MESLPAARPALLVLLLASLLGGCTCASDSAATAPSGCDPACGAGETCVDGTCVADGADAATEPPDASPGGDGGATPDAAAQVTDPNNAKKDTDCDGLSDAEEFSRVYAGGRKTDPMNPDSDGDGLPDGVEAGRGASIDPACAGFQGDADVSPTTSPVDADSDGDGIRDGVEDANHDGKREPGETDPSVADSDGDGIADGREDRDGDGTVDPGETDPLRADSDGDRIPDGVEDANHDGARDPSESDPAKADTDGDGCPDGAEDKNLNGRVDSGETDPKVKDCGAGTVDTDGDGIPDDVERTVTKTDPFKADTDGDGLEDGLEDLNANGVVDPGETGALRQDTDCDGLGDGEELRTFRTDPLKPDTDGDLVLDGVEAGKTASPDPKCTFAGDKDPATKSLPLVKDSDGDGIDDGVEDQNHDGRVDLDESSPARLDTDLDGLRDDLEDKNKNGKRDPGETHPNRKDTDGDGLSDGAEDANHSGAVDPGETSPLSLDSDCDGLADGLERASFRTDPTNPDTDGDGLTDGMEAGRTASPQPGCNFVPDADPSTTTSPTIADTDLDGLADGVEDANKNGKADPGESDPRRADTDADGLNDGLEDKNRNGVKDATETSATVADTDGDGLKDGTEDANHDGVKQPGETNPLVADTDGDTCLDGAEDANGNHLVDPGETNPLVGGDCPRPQLKDTDCDGLADTAEDKNGNGAVDPGETDPNNPDTDGDGLKDGLERGATANPAPATCAGFTADLDPSKTTSPLSKDSDCDGLADATEDANKNGKVDPGETDPSNPDTDGDGLKDGVELGVCAGVEPTCTTFVPDADCGQATRVQTNPLNPDSDGDGILDGAEDTNGNGRVDPGELNPMDPTDAVGPVQKACVVPRVIQSFERQDGDLTVAAVADFTESTTVTVGGKAVGAMLYDPVHKVAAFAVHVQPPQATAAAQETDGRAKLQAEASLTSAITQGFTSWDGFAGVQASYAQAGTVDLKARANALLLRFAPGATGTLAGTAGVTGPFSLQAEYLRRSANRAVVIVALVPTSLFNTGDTLFRVDDLANGTALAQFGDAHRPICEKFQSAPFPKVDFLWVVDNSCSMNDDQQALGNAVAEMQAQLAVAPIDWRVGTAYTDTDRPKTYNASPATVVANNKFQGFTTSLAKFKTDAAPCVRTDGTVDCNQVGSGTERGFEPVRWMLETNPTAAERLLPTAANDPARIRTGAKLVVVWLTDAVEQSNPATTNFTAEATWPAYFASLPGGVGAPFVSGITCPEGIQCTGESMQTAPARYHHLLTDLQGVEADIRNLAAINQAVGAIIKAAIGSATTTKLQKPPISASLKVALAGPTVAKQGPGCVLDDVPRSRTHGFDFDGASKALIFYGDCRPDPATPQTIAASYRYWTDLTPNPDGNPPPCGGPCPAPRVCDPLLNACVCPSDCGGCPAGKACDAASCACVCPADCGGACTGNFSCDVASCGCVCQQNVTCGPGFRFDTASCGCVCDTAALACSGNTVADAATCSCRCKPDCGGCAPGTVCDAASCACACDTTKPCGPNEALDLATCSCRCDTASLLCPPETTADAASCSCVCKPNCGNCETGLKCDPASCQCVCDATTPCPAGTVRDAASCLCVCDPTLLNCAAPRVADLSSCSCACTDCGGCAPGLTCDTASCSCFCDTTKTCAPGLKLDPASCKCVCDTAALNCGPTYDVDAASCACVCKPGCGGCPAGQTCSLSTCKCSGGPT